MKKICIISISSCFIALLIGWALRLWMPRHDKIRPALPPHSFYSFTLTKSDAHIPCLQAKIEGIPFIAELDMGYDGVLILPKNILEQLTKKYDAGTVVSTGIKGKKYETPVFTIPKLHIENLTLVNFPAEESSLEFERDASLRTKKNLDLSSTTARVGWQAFLGTVVLIDLSKSIAICCDSLETLKERGYPVDQFVSTSILLSEKCIEFEANIGNRLAKCLLDTGCTLNFIHTDSPASDVVSEKPEFCSIDLAHPLPPIMLSIGGQHLGPCVFHQMQLLFGFEAILGVDFLETHIVCIDLINKKIHLVYSS